MRLALVNLGEKPMEETASEVWESARADAAAAAAPSGGKGGGAGWVSGEPAVVRAREPPFHVASMQFALHYMFQSLRRARCFFRDLSSWLTEGGERGAGESSSSSFSRAVRRAATSPFLVCVGAGRNLTRQLIN